MYFYLLSSCGYNYNIYEAIIIYQAIFVHMAQLR